MPELANKVTPYSQETADLCPSCNTPMQEFYRIPNVPTNSCILMDTAEEARKYPRGDIVLGFCPQCGFICNLAFSPDLTKYSSRYEETQAYSGTFNRYHSDLATDLTQRLDVKEKTVLEIGCGKGEFLQLLCQIGDNQGIGFDPGFDQDRGIFDDVPGVKVIPDFYSERYKQYKADLVCCKMTLEHIRNTAHFVRLARQAMRGDGSSILYIQVPESQRIFEQCAFEDIYYEHCNYFTSGSLAGLLATQGFKVKNLYTSYSGQYLAAEAVLENQGKLSEVPLTGDLDALKETLLTFARRNDAKINDWRQRLESLAEQGSVVLWGSGSKAVSFLNSVDRSGLIDRVVDINPYRQGHYMPGSAQPIVSPTELRKSPPIAVIVMNAIYQEEIRESLDSMDINTKIYAL
jgi:SAM-dependent methyltransferase